MNKGDLKKIIFAGIGSQAEEVHKKIRQLADDDFCEQVKEQLWMGLDSLNNSETDAGRRIAQINARLVAGIGNCSCCQTKDKNGLVQRMAELRGCSLPGEYLNKKI